jgi:hypothetical protein
MKADARAARSGSRSARTCHFCQRNTGTVYLAEPTVAKA